jgi:hypothetical protein
MWLGGLKQRPRRRVRGLQRRHSSGTAAWVVYLVYELRIHAGVFCSSDGCVMRTPLYFVYLLLAFLSVVALVQVYVHIRDNRHREPLPRIRR